MLQDGEIDHRQPEFILIHDKIMKNAPIFGKIPTLRHICNYRNQYDTDSSIASAAVQFQYQQCHLLPSHHVR